ncbi:MAG: non-canonical purine NTP pyrophosphatase, RdgB/HAM1 family [Verrucomicrobia bacterium Tous-C9LFEB]|nr:MAG: non-canonical purine NTP pyrophosphatase, RdgB/HAM1 family [Verrucomicrobia bacterium Tous-C9LFEB]
MPRRTLTLATRNRHKVTELAQQLSAGWEVKSIADYAALPHVEEDGDTFQANAALKAVEISRHVPGFVLADDSGLEVDILGGAPGVYSARYAGLPSNDANNNKKLLVELEKANALTVDKRRARFRCVLVLAADGQSVESFEGSCEGHIDLTLRGTNGFGYDPLFIPDGYSQSFGELANETKAEISHRARALAKFLHWASLAIK